MKRILGPAVITAVLVAALVLSGPPAPAAAAESRPAVLQHQPAGREAAELAPAGRKNRINDDRWFTWEFDRTPRMGTVVVKVKLFDAAGRRVTDLEITGRSDMSSMRGYHDSGEVKFKVSGKGDYLLPVNVVMPGDWEVVLTFRSGDNVLVSGRISFKV